MINGENAVPTLADLTPGTIGFARHVSPRAADLLILAGQTFLGEPGYPHHVFVVTASAGKGRTVIGFPDIVQAMPSGAEEIAIGDEHWTKDYLYVRPRYVSPMDAERVAEAARDYIGTPYSFLDYLALAGRHATSRKPTDRTRFDKFVTRTGHMICSQLADQAMTDAGWHTFNDGRIPQDVTPGALYAKLMSLPGEHLEPGRNWQPNGTAHKHP